VPSLADVSDKLSHYQITAEPIDSMPNGGAPAISSADAVATARANFGFIDSADATAELVSFTDTNLGTESNGTVSPSFVQVPAWLVLTGPVQIPVFGRGVPVGSSPDTSSPVTLSQSGNMAVIIDAASGSILEAVAV
jgi:hypothetical protein